MNKIAKISIAVLTVLVMVVVAITVYRPHDEISFSGPDSSKALISGVEVTYIGSSEDIKSCSGSDLNCSLFDTFLFDLDEVSDKTLLRIVKNLNSAGFGPNDEDSLIAIEEYIVAVYESEDEESSFKKATTYLAGGLFGKYRLFKNEETKETVRLAFLDLIELNNSGSSDSDIQYLATGQLNIDDDLFSMIRYQEDYKLVFLVSYLK